MSACKRAPVTLDGGRRYRPETWAEAERIVDESGLVDVVEPLMIGSGRPRLLTSVRGVLVAAQLNAMDVGHRGHILDVARVIDAMTDAERVAIGAERWTRDGGKDCVYRWFARLAGILEAAPTVELDGEPVVLDGQTFLNRLILGSVRDAPIGGAVAIDGTAVPTWATTYGDPDLMQELPEEDDGRPAHMKSRKRRRKGTLKVLGTGPDGRPIYTVDRDARGGFRTATNSTRASRYVGFEGHAAVQAPGITWTNYVDDVRFGPDVPGLILAFELRPGVIDRTGAAMNLLRRVHRHFPTIDEYIVDAGYSLRRPETLFLPAAALGFKVVFDLQQFQRGTRPFAGAPLLIDGTLFSEHLPASLIAIDDNGEPVVLPSPPTRADLETKLHHEKAFNQRARWRYGVHEGPDVHGYRRMKCPFCAGRLVARAFPASLRNAKRGEMVHVPGPPRRCCDGTTTISAGDAVYMQQIPYGTTAWRLSYGRRNVAESANAGLKCQFVNIEGGHSRTMTMTKRSIMLGFTIAGYNRYRLAAYNRRQAEMAVHPVRRRPRRTRRYADFHGEAST